MTAQRVIGLDAVTVAYGRHVVLREVTLDFVSGETVGIRGSNGAGKTTLLRLLANTFEPTAGTRSGPSTSAYVPATITPPALSGHGWLTLPRPRRDDAHAALEVLGFDGSLDSPTRSLSFGNFRKLLLAEALTSGERLITIDEATSGLDNVGIRGLRNLVAAAVGNGGCVVVADQDSRDIPDANRVLLVGDGSVREIHDATRTIEVTLRGPADQVSALRQGARRLGFTPVDP